MLSDKYRYVAMDFETTWLDVSKDEAIQIWLVEIDVNWNIVNQYKSFLKPEKPVSELKSLVAYITWISIDDIQTAPSIFDVKDDILKFFWENTILIGHNIEFDINFLKKYFHDVKYFDSIDTFYLAQNLIHYPLSYALDVLVETLMTNKIFKEYFLKLHWGQEYNENNIHDWLYDSQNSLTLFLYEINRMDTLFLKYQILNKIISKNVWLYHKLLNYQVDRAWGKNEKISVPALKKQLPWNKTLKAKLNIDLKKYKIWERYFVWNVDLSQLVMSLVSGNKDIIMSFSSVAKLNIVKNILNDAGIKNIGFAKWYTTIDQTKFSRFLNKDTFSDNEFLFIIKYFSILMNEWSVIELNTKADYKIHYYIQDEKKFEKYPIVLTTHGWLYSILQEQEHKYKNYDVCFFDTEMWYKWYNEYLSKPCDLYSILNFLEILFYKYTLDEQQDAIDILERFARFFEIFMWVLFSETKQLFVNNPEIKVTVNPILENINFYETNKLVLQFSDYKSLLQECLNDEDFQSLWTKIDQLFTVLTWLVDVQKIMYNQSEFYFTYAEAVKYTNWDEFKDVFPSWVYFLSDFEKWYPKLLDQDSWWKNLLIKKIWNKDKVVEFVNNWLSNNNWKICFILSTIKTESKELFDKFFEYGLSDNVALLVENITWSLGKNVFKAKASWTKIIIWGYSFLIWLFSNWINIDICIEFNIMWKMLKYLLDDIQRYARKNNI